jgi:hypothetical protein
VTGRPVRYGELTPGEWHKELVAGSGRLGGEPNLRAADHLVAQSLALRANPIPVIPDHVLEFTGRAPVSFASFVAARQQELTPQA